MWGSQIISDASQIIPWKLWLIYGLSLLYLTILLRREKLSFFSYILILQSFAGVFEYLELNKVLNTIIYISLFLYWLLQRKEVSRIMINIVFIAYCLIFPFLIHGAFGLVGYFGQFIMFTFPLLFFALLDVFLNGLNVEREVRICMKVLNVQIVASLLKLIFMGINEKLAGTLTIAGGSVPTLFSVIYFVFVFILRKGNLNKKDWVMVSLSLLMPIASGKRGIWFFFPVVIVVGFYIYGKIRINFKTLRFVFLIPLIIYFGVRLNPTLNPEKKMWGTFDLVYTMEYAVAYNLGSTNEDDIKKVNADEATGRIGSTIYYLKKIVEDPFLKVNLFGIGNYEYNNAEARHSGLGFNSKYMLTAWLEIFVRFGLVVVVVYTLSMFRMLKFIKGFKREQLLIALTFLLFFTLYTPAITKNGLLIIPLLYLIIKTRKDHLDLKSI